MKPAKSAILLTFILMLAACRSDNYKKALKAMEAGRYSVAYKIAVELKNYEDAQTIALYCRGMEQLRGVIEGTTTLPVEFELRKAFENLIKAGDFRDSPQRAQDCLVEILARGYWDNWRHKPFESFPEVWENLDDAHKRALMAKAAVLLAEETVTEADPVRAWSRSIKNAALRWIAIGEGYLSEADQALYVKGVQNFMLALLDKGYRNGTSYTSANEILNSVKALPGQNRDNEALYETAARFFTDETFKDAMLRKWDAIPGSDPEGWAELHRRVFTFLGDYKESGDYALRCQYYLNADFLTEDEILEEETKFGKNPKKRTVAFCLKQDGAFQDPQFLWQLTKTLRFLKQKTLGNLYFTKNPAEAGLVLELSVKRKNSGSYAYVDEQKGLRSQAVYYDKNLTVTALKPGIDKPVFARNYTAKAPAPYEKLVVGTNSVEAVVSEDIMKAIRDDLYEEALSKIEF
jgi:hypothetical protein